MQINLDSTTGIQIRAYSDGELWLGEERVTEPVLLTRTAKLGRWDTPSIADMTLESLAPLLETRPEVLLIGTGGHQDFPSQALVAKILSGGVGVEAMTTSSACRTFNLLVAEGRNVAAALII